MDKAKKLTICLTGATGFIGSNLLTHFEKNNDFNIVALSRKLPPRLSGAKKGNVEWRRCNAFSHLDVEKATEGCDILIYLIHSMLPSTSFTQGHFKDFDLYLADNFMRAAKKHKIKKIIYLTGIIPHNEELSDHLSSRLEVEKALGEMNNLIALRASIVIGKNGSSFKIIERLIKRLPILVCPAWTRTKTQPIHLNDVIASIDYVIKDNIAPGAYDIGGPDILTYKEMMMLCAKVLDKKRYFFNVPLLTPTLSKLWVSNITMVSKDLIYPLVESLKHSMVVHPKKELTIPGHEYKHYIPALKESFTGEEDGWFREVIDYTSQISMKWLKNVTYIQRIHIPLHHSGKFLAEEYFKWLPRFMRPFINVKVFDDKVQFCLFGNLRILKLKLAKNRSTEDRWVYYITGGLLAKKRTLSGRLEFRNVPARNCHLIILIDYRPSMPWFIYKFTQAKIHHFAMMRFQKYLEKKYRS